MKGEPLVLAAAMALPTITAWVYFVTLAPAATGEVTANRLFVAAYSVSKVVQFGLPVVWMWFAEPSALRPRRPDRRGVRAGVAFGVIVAAIAFGLYYGMLAGSSAFAGVPERLRAKVGGFGLGTPAGFLVLAAFIAVAHAALEEYYWRWFVFGRLRRHIPVAVAAVASGLAFMGHHVVVLSVYFPENFWTAVIPFSLCIALGGVVWAWLYDRSGSLLGPWVSHVIVDVALMGIGYDLLFRRGS